MTMPDLPEVARTIVETLAARPEVAAIAATGSLATGARDAASDIDLCVFTTASVPVAVRRELAMRFDPAPEIANRWFGEDDAVVDAASGVLVDVMYWDTAWIADRLDAVIDRHEAHLGYTTALWFTVRQAVPLADRDGWLAALQARASVPYPAALREAIVAHNRPLLRGTRASYRHQVALAIARGDVVSVQHRVTALLASAVDIVFAVAGALHPGEKRLVAKIAALGEPCAPVSEHIAAVATCITDDALLPAIDALCDDIDRLVAASTAADTAGHAPNA